MDPKTNDLCIRLTNLCLESCNGTSANSADPDQRQKKQHLIRVYTICRRQTGVSQYFVKQILDQGLVVQSIVSLTSSLKGQLVKCFTTL